MNSRDIGVWSESTRAVGARLPVRAKSETSTRNVIPCTSAKRRKIRLLRRWATSIRQLATQLFPMSPLIADGGEYFDQIWAPLTNAGNYVPGDKVVH
jgi:hypothetical protein